MKGISGRRWEVLSDYISPSKELISAYGELLAQLIANRGFEKEHEKFLELKLKNLPSYTNLPNVEEGVEKIVKAVKDGKRIIVFGDYDADGITGTAILYRILKLAGAKVVPVLPSRNTGYGLNKELMDLFSKYGDLLITVDNGSSAVAEIESSNIDVVIIDHHNVPSQKPKKAILINPKIGPDVSKDMKELSSSAMCFYVSILLTKRLGIEADMRLLLDLVALGTVGDVMPMNITNRILVSKGIKVLESIYKGEIHRPGLKALMELSRVGDKVSAKDIAFYLAPRINAPGRIGDPTLSLKILLEEDPKRARLLAQKINQVNLKRRSISEKVYREAYNIALKKANRNFISLWNPYWSVGVLGIVAGRLSSELGKPVAVFCAGKNNSVGSVRSVEGVDVYSGLNRLSHMFLKWGGHTQAAGLTIRTSLLERFSAEADEVFSHVPKEPPPLHIDTAFPLRSFNENLRNQLMRLEPFGEGNPYPTFLSEELKVERVSVGPYGGKVNFGKHTLICRDTRLLSHIRKGAKVRVVYSVEGQELYLIDIEAENGSG